MSTPPITPPNAVVRRLRALLSHHRSAFAAVCALVGIVVGLAAVVFQYLIGAVSRLATGFTHYGATAGAPHRDWGWHPAFVIAVPIVTGLLCGIAVNRFSPFARGHGVPEVMLAVRRKGAIIPGRVAIVKIVATALTIGGGGPVGKEGPIVQVGSAIGSYLGQKLKLSTRQLALLCGAGAAAGIAATFNTPLAGAVFTLELIVVSFTAETIGMIVMASVCAAVVAHVLLGDEHFISLPQVSLATTTDLWWVAALAVIASLAGIIFSRSIYLMDDLITLVYRGPEWARPAVGGAFVGVGLYLVPHMYGDTTVTVHRVISGDFSPALVAVLLVAQIVLASLVIGMGGSGGVFGPTLFVGAASGALMASGIGQWTVSSPATFAVIAMGAAFAAAARAPLTAVLIIVEMTGQYTLILPMMLAVGLSTGVSAFLTRHTIYTTKLVRRGDLLDDPVEQTLIGRVRAAGLMGQAPAIIGPELNLHDAAAVIREAGAHAVPVVADDGTYVGTLGALAIARARETGVDAHSPVTAIELPRHCVRGNEFASVVLKTLMDSGSEGIAVVDTDTKLIGWVAQRDLVERIYRQQRRALDDARPPQSLGERLSRQLGPLRRRDALEANHPDHP